MMYGRTAKQIKNIALFSFIISIVATVIVAAIQTDDLSTYWWIIPVSPLILTFGFMSLFLNFKKIMIGIIRPIPILSMFIEYLKGFFCSIKALIWALKQPKNSSGANGTETY